MLCGALGVWREKLQASVYGMIAGVIPVLVLAVLIVNIEHGRCFSCLIEWTILTYGSVRPMNSW